MGSHDFHVSSAISHPCEDSTDGSMFTSTVVCAPRLAAIGTRFEASSTLSSNYRPAMSQEHQDDQQGDFVDEVIGQILQSGFETPSVTMLLEMSAAGNHSILADVLSALVEQGSADLAAKLLRCAMTLPQPTTQLTTAQVGIRTTESTAGGATPSPAEISQLTTPSTPAQAAGPTLAPSAPTALDAPAPVSPPAANQIPPSSQPDMIERASTDSAIGTDGLAAAVAAIDLSPGGTDADVALATAAASASTTVTAPPAPCTSTTAASNGPAAAATPAVGPTASQQQATTTAVQAGRPLLDYRRGALILGLLVDSDLVPHAASVVKHLLVEHASPDGGPASLDAHDAGQVLGHCVAVNQPEWAASILIAIYNEKVSASTESGGETSATTRNGPPCQQLLPFALGALLDCGSKAWAETLATHLLYSDGASDDEIDVNVLGWCLAKSVWAGRADWAAELLDLIKQQRHDWFHRRTLIDAVVAWGGDQAYATAIESASKEMAGGSRSSAESVAASHAPGGHPASTAPSSISNTSSTNTTATAAAGTSAAAATTHTPILGYSNHGGRGVGGRGRNGNGVGNGYGGGERGGRQPWAGRQPQQQQQRHGYAPHEEAYRYQQQGVAAAAAAAAQGYGYGYPHAQAQGFNPYAAYGYPNPAMYNAAALYAAGGQVAYGSAEAYGAQQMGYNQAAWGRGGYAGYPLAGGAPTAMFASSVGNPQMVIPGGGVMYGAGAQPGAGGNGVGPVYLAAAERSGSSSGYESGNGSSGGGYAPNGGQFRYSGRGGPRGNSGSGR